MPRPATVNISMPPELRDLILERIRTGQFGNVSEYFRHLAREDLRQRDLRRLEEMLLEGLDSGPGEPMTADWIEQRRAKARSAGRKASRKAG